MKRIIFLFLSIVTIHNGAYALYPPVQNFSKEQSKAGTQSWDIIQHQNHWMYFANNNGLVEFDGYRWSIYPIRNYTNIRSLYYDDIEDRIYAGAYNELGYYCRNERGILSYHSLIEEINVSERNFNEIWKIHRIDDALFFQGNREIFRYKSGTMKRFDFNHKIDCSANLYHSLIIADSNKGVQILNGDIFIVLPYSEILKNKKICAILPFQDKKILFVTDFQGLYVFDGEKVVPYKTDIDPFLYENQVFCATIKGSKLAIGTVRNGLVIKDLDTDANTYSNIHTGLQNNTVLSLAFDAQDNLWLGLDKGIDLVMINSPVYNLFGNKQQFGAGYTSIIKDNMLYFGTNQGLYATQYPLKTSPEPLNLQLIDHMQGQVWFLKTIDRTLFCGTDHGIFIVDGKHTKQIPPVSGTWNLIRLDAHPNYILGASYQGFFLLKKVNGQWVFSNFIDGFTDSGGMFEEDAEGNIWFSHWIKGIFKLKLNEKMDAVSVELFDTSKGFYTERNNLLFKIKHEIIFSSDGGFYEYDYKANCMKHSEKFEKLFGIQPYSVRLYESPSGDIWSISHQSINIAFRQADKTYRLIQMEFATLINKLILGFENFNAVDNSHLIISTEDGFSWLDVEKAKTDMQKQTLPKVAIRNVYLTKERDAIVDAYQEVQRVIPAYKFKENSIRFEFVAAEFGHEKSITYSYLLDGYDVDWSQFSATNTKEYTKLPKGTYVFKVKAQNLLGRETAETTYQFTILPPWYESWIAIVVYIMIVLASLFRLFTFIKKRSEKGALEMQRKKETEMYEQKERFQADAKKKENEIIALKNQQLQYELRHKSQELASSTMNLIRKNEILLEINRNIERVSSDIREKNVSEITKKLGKMQQEIKLNIEQDDNWKKFAENFDIVYENYLKHMGERYPHLTISDKKLCAYLRMGLRSKDIAPLLNMSFRSVEMSRYRLRKKLDIDRDINLTDFLQNFK
ncbi:MAG: hypothetical protein LBM08_14685 [Dysgonamonadaceae bacterium]|jgi:ligand-binding sensor domain-containing protein|nr:hypothetical protein [Dysgonamonadaceae bacterium]